MSTTGPLTLIIWFKTQGNVENAGYHSLFSKGGVFTNNSAFATGIRMDQPNTYSYPYFVWKDNTNTNGTEYQNMTTDLSNNLWHQLAVTRNADQEAFIYVDGEFICASKDNHPGVDGGMPILVGDATRSNYDETSWSGEIGSISVFDYPLSKIQIQSRYFFLLPSL